MGQVEGLMPEKKLEDEVGDVESFLDFSIPPEVEEYGRTRVGETPESRTQLLEDLRECVYQRGDVTPLRMDDEYLLRFLRARNFKLEPTYRLIQNYCQFREENIHYYDKVDPISLSFIGDSDIISVLPYREQSGRRIIIYKIGKWNPSEVVVDDLFKGTVASIEAGLLEPRSQILGGIAIFDMEGLSLQHALNITPAVVSKVYQIMVTCFPLKVMAIHVVNESWIFDKIFSMFKPLFGSKRYTEMLFFHGSNMESLHEHINPEYLPKVYGGIRPEYGYLEWFSNLSREPKVIEAMKELGYDVELARDTAK